MRGCGLRGVLVVCVFMLSVSAVPARALTVHKLKGTFGEEGANPGQFKGPVGVAVNASSGDVYVADAGNNRVERFDATGTFLGRFDGSGTYEVEGKVETGSAAPTGALSHPELVAFDNGLSLSDPSREDVYVADRGHGAIDKFSAVGEYLGAIVGTKTCIKFEPGEANPCSITGLAVDAAGSVWVSVSGGPIYSFTDAAANQESSECETEFGGIDKLVVGPQGNLYFERSGGTFAKATSACETLLNPFGEDSKAHSGAVDPSARVIYLDNREYIESFDLEGRPIESEAAGAQAEPFGSGDLSASKALAVNTASGDVYASDSERNNVVVFEAIMLPSVTVGPPTDRRPHSVTLNGTVDPEGRSVTSCVFEYDTRPYTQGEDPHGTSVACSPDSPGSGASPVPVSANLTGLTPQISYYYRLAAENSGGKSTSGGQELFTGPLVEGEWSVDVASGSATVQTRIDPNGDDTSYYVEYGPTVALGSYAPLSPPGVDLGADVGPQTVSSHPQGLTASTTYYYRVVAVQNGETFGCDAASVAAGECGTTLRTLNAPATGGLLDGRMWELASPADKKGALIEAQTEQGGQIQAASDGSGITYITRGPHVGEEPAGHVTYSQVLSRRDGGEGWRSVDLTLPGRLPEGEAAKAANSFAFEYRLFSPTLSSAAVEPQLGGTPPLAPGVTERTLYLRDNERGSYLPLVTAADTSSAIEPGTNEHTEWSVHFIAASPDLMHVVFKTPVALTGEAVDEESPTVSCVAAPAEPHCYEVGANIQWNIYEWGEGELRLVNLLPSGLPAHGRFAAGIPGVRLAGTENAGGLAHNGAQRAMSSDGRRVAWTWGEPYTGGGLKEYRGLYVRDMTGERTVRIGGPGAVYQTMSGDGSKIFYLEDGELYEYAWEIGAPGGTTSDLTVTHEGGELSAEVQETISDVSEDGSYVYLIAKGTLAPGSAKGGYNLYLLHEAAGHWTTTFIATLAGEDRPSWYAVFNGEAPFLANISSRVSPDGRFLAFMSQRPLTGYDNVDAVSGRRAEEVYLYDAEQGRLVCASCDPTGARPVGVLDTGAAELLVDRQGTWTSNASVERDRRTDHWLAGSIPAWDNLNNSAVTYQPQYLSDSGRLFFDSPGALVSQDTNGLEDVYEFEPEGVGGCTSATASGAQVYVSGVAGHAVGGCVGLASSGTSGAESAFLDASENGDDVFFVTTSKLAGEDYDKGYDVYDAHVCSSSVPCVTRGESPPPCSSGDSCKPAPSPQPGVFGAPPSATFEGSGNVAEAASGPVTKPRSLTKAQKLAHALKACRKKKGKRQVACQRSARRQFPVRRSAKHAKASGRSSR
jgi:hypothetical protein